MLKHVKRFMLGRVSWDTVFWEYNDVGSKTACRSTLRMNCERESIYVKRFVGTRLFIWDTLFWEYNDGGSKRACLNTPNKELLKKVETC